MVTLLVAGAWLLAFSGARAEEPLFEQEPYDQITLDEANGNAVLQIEPLDLPGRRVPQNPRPSEKLAIRLLDKPGTVYEVQWYSIAKLELFEQLVLTKAGALVKAGRLDEAYDYFKFLKDKDPKLPGLDAAIEDYLFEEAKSLHRDGQYEAALAVLRELYRRNPQRPEVEKALGVTTEVLVGKHVAAEHYQAARELIRNLAAWYPQHAVVEKWQGQFKAQAGAFLNEARQALEAGQLHEAHRAGRRLVQVWPDLPDAREVVETIHGR
jgi:tetratricopeptide (TPR) repeat protein